MATPGKAGSKPGQTATTEQHIGMGFRHRNQFTRARQPIRAVGKPAEVHVGQEVHVGLGGDQDPIIRAARGRSGPVVDRQCARRVAGAAEPQITDEPICRGQIDGGTGAQFQPAHRVGEVVCVECAAVQNDVGGWIDFVARRLKRHGASRIQLELPRQPPQRSRAPEHHGPRRNCHTPLKVLFPESTSVPVPVSVRLRPAISSPMGLAMVVVAELFTVNVWSPPLIVHGPVRNVSAPLPPKLVSLVNSTRLLKVRAVALLD